MTKRETTLKIKKYVEEHKELQGTMVTAKALDDAGKALNLDTFYIMSYLRYGRLI